MDQAIQYFIEGFPVGCVYALVAVGLVLTYKTSGVFNLAFGAQAFLSAALFYALVERDGWDLLPAFVVSVVIVAPLAGLVLDRALFRYMRNASWVVKLVTSLGLFVALPEIIKAFFGSAPEFGPPSVAPLLGIDANRVFHFGDYVVAADRIAATIVTLVVVALLFLLFRYTAVGLQMRAIVESFRMVELAGVDSERVSMTSWMLSSLFAGLAGVLLAPLFATLDANNYVLLLVSAVAAAAFGRLTSIPLALLGGLILGVGQRALAGELPTDSILARGIRPGLPFIVLFLLLILLPAFKGRREVTDPLAGVDPPPPAMAHQYKDPELARVSKRLFPVFVIGFLVVMCTLVSNLWVLRITDAFTLAITFLSITIFTGLGGQVSLGQAAFAGIGGYTMANLTAHEGIPVIVSLLAGMALAALVGAALAIPALRLGGIFLTLATLAFALCTENLFFSAKWVSGGTPGIDVRRPSFLDGNDLLGRDQMWFLFVFVIFAIVGYLVIFIRQGTTGRFFAALRGSETAAASIGINGTRQRIVLFALSAAIAGLGGGLMALHVEHVDPLSYPSLLGAAWVVLVVSLGARTVDGAVNAALGFVIFSWLLSDALQLDASYALILFGFGAITYARHPEGIVELQTRKSIVATVKGRVLQARAARLKAEGRLPAGFTPVHWVAAGITAGPVAYTVYLLLRTAVQGHWVAVHSGTVLVCVVPSVLFALAWMVRTDRLLWRAGGSPRGWAWYLGGAVAGPVFGAVFADQGWARASVLDGTLVGIPAGMASVAFFWLGVQITAVARRRDWPAPPLDWKAGRTPFGFVVAAVFLLYRATTETPPSGWPVFFIAAVTVIVWTQWAAGVQGACNELWLGRVDLEVEALGTPDAVPREAEPERVVVTAGGPMP